MTASAITEAAKVADPASDVGDAAVPKIAEALGEESGWLPPGFLRFWPTPRS